MADLYYIEEGYYDAGYFVYTADAAAAVQSTSSVTAVVGKNQSIDLLAFQNSSVTATASRIRTSSSAMSSTSLVSAVVGKIIEQDDELALTWDDLSGWDSVPSNQWNSIGVRLPARFTISALLEQVTGQPVYGEGAWSSVFTQTADVSRTRSTTTDLASQFTQTTGVQVNKTAASAISSTITATTEATKQSSTVSAALISQITQTAVAVKTVSAVINVSALFSPSMTANGLKNQTATFESNFVFTANVVANRSANITLDTIASLNAQNAKFAGVSSDLTSRFTFTAQVTGLEFADAALVSQFTQTTSVVKLKRAEATLITQVTLSATAFDLAERPRQFTPVGTPAFSTSIKKFGTHSYYSTNSSNYVTIPDSNSWSTGTWRTFDCWVYIPTDPSQIGSINQNLLRQFASNSSNQSLLLVAVSSGIKKIYRFQINVTSGSSTVALKYEDTTNGIIGFDTWAHIRVLNDGSAYHLWINGSKKILTSEGSDAYISNLNIAAPIELNKNSLPSNYSHPMYMDELLITTSTITGSGTSSFSVPTQPWIPNNDQNQTDILVLSHFDGVFDDDMLIIEIGQAAIVSTATLTASATKTNGPSSASLLARFTQTSQIDKLSGQRATLNAQTTLTAIVGLRKPLAAGLSVTSTLTAQAESSVTAAFSSLVTLTAQGQTRANRRAALSTTVVLTARLNSTGGSVVAFLNSSSTMSATAFVAVNDFNYPITDPTRFLLKLDGSTIVDSYGHSVTGTGGVVTTGKFGSAHQRIPGVNNWSPTRVDHPDFSNLITKDWTLEFWFKPYEFYYSDATRKNILFSLNNRIAITARQVNPLDSAYTDPDQKRSEIIFAVEALDPSLFSNGVLAGEIFDSERTLVTWENLYSEDYTNWGGYATEFYYFRVTHRYLGSNNHTFALYSNLPPGSDSGYVDGNYEDVSYSWTENNPSNRIIVGPVISGRDVGERFYGVIDDINFFTRVSYDTAPHALPPSQSATIANAYYSAGYGRLDARASITATPTKVVVTSAALSATSTLTATATKTARITKALAVTSTLVSRAGKRQQAAGALSSTSIVSATITPTKRTGSNLLQTTEVTASAQRFRDPTSTQITSQSTVSVIGGFRKQFQADFSSQGGFSIDIVANLAGVALLECTSTLAAIPTITRRITSDIVATATMSIVAGFQKQASAALVSESTIAVTSFIKVPVQFNAALESVSTATVSFIRYREANAAIESTTTVQAAVNRNPDGFVPMSVISVVDATAQRFRDPTQTNLAATVTQTSSIERYRQGAADLVSTATTSATATRIKQFSSDLVVTAQLACLGGRLNDIDLISTSFATMTIVAVKTARTSSAVQSQATLTADNVRVRFSQAAITSTATLTAAAVKTTDITKTLDTAFTQTAAFRRFRDPNPTAFNAQFTQTANGNKDTDIIGQFAVTATVVVEIFVSKAIQAEAALTVTSTMTTVNGRRRNTAVALAVTVTSSASIRKITGFTIALTCTTSATPFLVFYFRGGRANLVSQGFVLTAGEVINIDPRLQLIIKPETRRLVIVSETRVLQVL